MVLGFKTKFKSGEPTRFPEKILQGIKIHSLRPGQRWRAGLSIHFATGVRTKAYNQFYFGECKSVQEIEIYYPSGNVFIDGELFFDKERLAKNDGFDSFEELLDWFGKDGLNGQIIHWTDYRY